MSAGPYARYRTIAAHVQTAHTSAVTPIVAARANGSALSTMMSTPEIPIATGTPIPSTAVWTDRRVRSGSTWYIALIEVRVVPSVRAMSAMRAADTVARSASDAPPLDARTTIIPMAKIVTTSGLAVMPSRRPNRRSSGPATANRKAMLTTFMTAV